MGNRGDPRYVPALAEALAGGPPVVRRHAAWALGRIAASGGERAARRALEAACGREAEPTVRREIAAALGPGPEG